MIITIEEQRSTGVSKDGSPMVITRRYKLFGVITIFAYKLQHLDGGQIK
jgi:hypothetical protein